MRQIIALTVGAWLLGTGIADPQTPAPTEYRVLSTNRLSTLQAELVQAANDGYRVLASLRPALLVRAVVLERSNDKRDYFISDALPQDVRDRKVPPGYHILTQTVGSANGPCAAIFERSSNGSAHREYRIEDAVYPGNLQKDILNAATEGYRVLVIGAGAGFCAVLERDPQAPSAGAPTVAGQAAAKEKKIDLSAADYSRPYVLIATNRTSTLEKELAEAAAHGYRLQSGAAADELVYLMERQVEKSPQADYLVLSTTKTETLEREMNQAAARGYRLHPLSLTGILRSFSGTFETVAVMEKQESPTVEYRVIGAGRPGTFEKELVVAREQGWELAATVRSGAFTAALQRRKS